MFILITFAFLAGIVTVLSPCILPVLPIVLSSGLSGSRSRAYGIVLGFITSFTFFTLFLTSIVKVSGIPAGLVRNISVVIIFVFGLSLLFNNIQTFFDRLFTKLTGFMPQTQKRGGLVGGIIMGLSIGLIWTPCVGPILASVISAALTATVTGSSVVITLSYAFGTSLPMLIIIAGGQGVLSRHQWFLKNSAKIQKTFGVVMMLVAVLIFFNFDREFQTFILEKFPGYGVGLTKIEDNPLVNSSLENIKNSGGGDTSKENMGKPTFSLLDTGGNSAPEIIPGGQWFNSDAITLDSLKGKVVLVDFWTYTCINCIRTLPYLRDWYAKYENKGFVIIGVHTPEFEFEKNADNVKKAIADFNLKYPIVQDNNYATWTAYSNHYWPAKYLIDKNGKIRYTHFGEGNYDTTETAIQALLKESGEKIDNLINNPTYDINTQTPETYLGYTRMGYFASPEPIVRDKSADYTIPQDLPINHFAFQGRWLISSENSAPSKGSKLIIGFSAKNVFLVMRTKGSEGVVSVSLDQKKVSENNRGEDVKDGQIVVDQNRLYSLIKLTISGQHTLTLEFLDDNVEVYAFTFG